MLAFAHTPFKPVDVFYVDSQAASSALKLSNPYMLVYTVRGVGTNVLAYLPVVPLFYAPFSLLGDIRYGSIVADGVIMVSLYWIGRSISPRAGSLAAGAFALLPISIDLTSVASTNMMVGTMFLTLSLAALLRNRFELSAGLYGVALAANQLMLLAMPLLIYHFLRHGRAKSFSLAIVSALGVILPFFIVAPGVFLFDVAVFQFVRPLQPDGWLSLYSVVYSLTGLQLSLWVRLAAFAAATAWALSFSRKSKHHFIFSIAFTLALGSFVLPVNGFWNYLLAPCTVACAFTPTIYSRMVKERQLLSEQIGTSMT